jgi:hypothetical protein
MQHRKTLGVALCLSLAGMAPVAEAFVADIGNGLTPSIYLRVGDGVYTGTFITGGTPGSGGPINRVSVTVPAAALGNGTDLAMTGNATQAFSNYDGAVFCNVPSQVYVGGYNQGGIFGGSNGVLTVTAPATLVNATGATIPITQISWTSSGIGDTGPQPFPAGSFSGGVQTLATWPLNTWRESCHTFSYGNDNFVGAGTYNARVTYTLTVP